jgi:hypothetical protein
MAVSSFCLQKYKNVGYIQHFSTKNVYYRHHFLIKTVVYRQHFYPEQAKFLDFSNKKFGTEVYSITLLSILRAKISCECLPVCANLSVLLPGTVRNNSPSAL